MKTVELEQNKEYAYSGSEFIDRVMYKGKTASGYSFERISGSLKIEAELTESQVNSFIEKL